jgi:hypothetical protein
MKLLRVQFSPVSCYLLPQRPTHLNSLSPRSPLISHRHKERKFCVSRHSKWQQALPEYSSVLLLRVMTKWPTSTLPHFQRLCSHVSVVMLPALCARHLATVTTDSKLFDHATLQCHHAKNTPRPLFSREKNPRYLNRRFGGLQSPAGRFEEEKVLLVPGINSG